MQKFPTLIHERVNLAQQGQNKTVICRLQSGWVVLGDNQFLRGYTLLLADPIYETLNHAPPNVQSQFLQDMTHIGDALIAVLTPHIINYSILGNTDRALHAHIQPRFETEPDDKRTRNPYIYTTLKTPPIPFEYERDYPLMQSIKTELEKRTKLIT